MATELLYLYNSYLRETDAEVNSWVADNELVLNKTVIYPEGGGLPSDRGWLIITTTATTTTTTDALLKVEIINATKQGADVVVHRLSNSEAIAPPSSLTTTPTSSLPELLPVGTKLKCVLDWNRRYMIMRMHTATHILAAVLHSTHNALITGNRVDIDRTRIDFNVPEFDRELMESTVAEANRLIERNYEVKIYFKSREEALKIPGIVKLAKGLPPELKILRIVEIGNIDIQADGGVHVNTTAEIGKIKLLKLENKGKNNRRIYFTLEKP